MKNRKVVIGIALLVIAAVVAFFIVFSGNRGVGTYSAKSYCGLYDLPDNKSTTLVVTAQPGEELEVTHVSKSGWATVNYPEHGTLYTNYFGLKAEKVKYPILTNEFYEGSQAVLFLFQCLLWLIFIIAAVMLVYTYLENKKAIFITAVLLVATEIAYLIIHFAYISPTDILIETAFDKTLHIVIAFLVNMAGLVILGIAHIKLIKMAYRETKVTESLKVKCISWAILIFVFLFAVYIALKLIMMAIIVATIIFVITAGAYLAGSFFEYENSLVKLYQDPNTGRWHDRDGKEHPYPNL